MCHDLTFFNVFLDLNIMHDGGNIFSARYSKQAKCKGFNHEQLSASLSKYKHDHRICAMCTISTDCAVIGQWKRQNLF